MKTNDEVRRLNLLLAIERVGGKASVLAERAETSPAYLSQIKNKTPDSKTGVSKAMGDDVARRIEASIGEGVGWMDTPHPDEWENVFSKTTKISSPERHNKTGSADGMANNGSNADLSSVLTLTCETLDEYRLLVAHRYGGERGRNALNATVEEIHNLLSRAARKKT